MFKFFSALSSSFSIAISNMLLIWLFFLITKNPAIVDVGWVLSIGMMGFHNFGQLRYTTWIHKAFMALLAIWGARLAGFLLYTRIIPGHTDGRYTVLLDTFTAIDVLIRNYIPQAILATLFFFALHAVFSKVPYPMPLAVVAMVVIIIGIIGEAVADYQLYQFKQSGAQGICEVGLWKYSRHPNYFFEILIWVGFAIPGLRASTLAYSFITPIGLWVIMNYITIPITERVSLAKRPAYKAYMERTYKLLPLKRN